MDHGPQRMPLQANAPASLLALRAAGATEELSTAVCLNSIDIKAEESLDDEGRQYALPPPASPRPPSGGGCGDSLVCDPSSWSHSVRRGQAELHP